MKSVSILDLFLAEDLCAENVANLFGEYKQSINPQLEYCI